MEVLIAALIGAFAFRLRGSALFGRIPLLNRIPAGNKAMWAVVMGLLAYFLGGGHPALLLTAGGFGLGAVWGWEHSIDLGRHDGTFRSDAMTMLWRGPLWTIPAGLILFGLEHFDWIPQTGSWKFGAAGLLCVICYYVGWRVPLRIKHLTQGPEVGEFLFGAWLGAALALSLGGIV